MGRLSQQQRDEIWRMWQNRHDVPVTLRQLGERFGASDVTIGRVIKERREEEAKNSEGVAAVSEEKPEAPEKAPEPVAPARPLKEEARELWADVMDCIEEQAARTRKEAASSIVLTDVSLCGDNTGVSCWRKAKDEEFKCAVRLRAGSWDSLTRKEMEAIAWDLIAISAQVERLEAETREVG